MDNDYVFWCVKWVYRKYFRYNKYKYINLNIIECGKDVFKMYKFVFGLIGKINSNFMLLSISDELLVDEFSLFFMDKILIICKILDNFEKFDLNFGFKCINDFKYFDLVFDEDVLGVIKNLKFIICLIDLILLKLIK